MNYKLWRPPVPARVVPAWEENQRRILAEDREGHEGRLLAERIKALNVAPRGVRTA